MLGIGGRFAGAKGMVQMPDLANLTPEQAALALSSAGLRAKTQTSVTTSNSALGNKVFNQSFTAGQLVDYETDIDFSYYIYQAPAVTITYGPAEQYDSTTETGCNKTPNNQGSSNQYFFCTRLTRYFRSRLLENGVWAGGYGQYSTQTDTNWNCSIVADQCGNTQIGITEVVGSRSSCIGSPGTTGYQNVTYRRDYAAGTPTNVTYTVQEFGCVIPPAVTEVPCATPIRQETVNATDCKCGKATKTYNRICRSDNGAFIREEPGSRTCIETQGTVYRTPTYWFACGTNALPERPLSPNERRGTYRVETYDCVGNKISDERFNEYESCCSETTSCSAWVSTGTWTESRTCTIRNSDCSTSTRIETRCVPHCDIWRDASNCLGTYKIQTQRCQAADCSYYTVSRQVSCGGTSGGGGGGGAWIAV